jgi:hypothetical protein
MEQQSSPTEQSTINQEARDERRSVWKGAIEQELQSLITQAAGIRQRISTAKTATKRTYYQKKFNKISPQVMQMVAALERLNADNGDKVA